MGMLEDLLFGQQYRQPQYGGPWPEDVASLEEQLRRMQTRQGSPPYDLSGNVINPDGTVGQEGSGRPEPSPFGFLRGGPGGMMFGEAPMSEYYKESEKRAGLVAQEPAEVLREKAKAGIDERQTTEDAYAAETERMREEAYQSQLDPESWVTPSLRNDEHVQQTPEGKLMAIRAEARARGRSGSLGKPTGVTVDDYVGQGGGGTFSQQRSSPELEARLADRDKWAAGQPERDMEFLASAEMARRNPELAMSAAGKLEGLRAQKTEERQVANQEALIGALSKGGKVPFSMALQMEASGMKVPGWAVGSHPDAAKREIDRIIAGAREDMQDPMTDIAGQGYSQYIISMGERYKQMIDSGMDPDEAGKAFLELVNRHAVESGAMDSYMSRMQAQQQAQGE